MAAADEAELMHMVATAAAIETVPARSAIRAARASAWTCRSAGGAGDRQGQGGPGGHQRGILSFGARLQECLKAAEDLAARGLSTTVADARFAKPLDEDLIRASPPTTRSWSRSRKARSAASAASCCSSCWSGAARPGAEDPADGVAGPLPGSRPPAKQYEEAGLAARHIVGTALKALGVEALGQGIARA